MHTNHAAFSQLPHQPDITLSRRHRSFDLEALNASSFKAATKNMVQKMRRVVSAPSMRLPKERIGVNLTDISHEAVPIQEQAPVRAQPLNRLPIEISLMPQEEAAANESVSAPDSRMPTIASEKQTLFAQASSLGLGFFNLLGTAIFQAYQAGKYVVVPVGNAIVNTSSRAVTYTTQSAADFFTRVSEEDQERYLNNKTLLQSWVQQLSIDTHNMTGQSAALQALVQQLSAKKGLPKEFIAFLKEAKATGSLAKKTQLSFERKQANLQYFESDLPPTNALHHRLLSQRLLKAEVELGAIEDSFTLVQSKIEAHIHQLFNMLNQSKLGLTGSLSRSEANHLMMQLVRKSGVQGPAVSVMQGTMSKLQSLLSGVLEREFALEQTPEMDAMKLNAEEALSLLNQLKTEVTVSRSVAFQDTSSRARSLLKGKVLDLNVEYLQAKHQFLEQKKATEAIRAEYQQAKEQFNIVFSQPQADPSIVAEHQEIVQAARLELYQALDVLRQKEGACRKLEAVFLSPSFVQAVDTAKDVWKGIKQQLIQLQQM
jgi:hypothetical protein